MVRVVAALLCLIVLAPATAAASVCDAAGFDGIMRADCCCEGDAAPASQQRVDTTCCCEIDRPDGERPTRAPAVVAASVDVPALPACAVAPARSVPLAARTDLPDAPARAPPSGGWSLLSQGTSLLR